jgi:hypothetical protein
LVHFSGFGIMCQEISGSPAVDFRFCVFCASGSAIIYCQTQIHKHVLIRMGRKENVTKLIKRWRKKWCMRGAAVECHVVCTYIHVRHVVGTWNAKISINVDFIHGDQVGRIFAQRAIAFFGQNLKKLPKKTKFSATFSTFKVMFYF